MSKIVLGHSFTCTAHTFACSSLLALLARSTALTHLLTRSLHSIPSSCFFLFGTIVEGRHLEDVDCGFSEETLVEKTEGAKNAHSFNAISRDDDDR